MLNTFPLLPPPSLRRVRFALLIGLLALVAAGCGGSAEKPADPGPQVALEEGNAGHIHGVGIDPGDGSLYVATHSGLYSAREGEAKARRVGESRQDTMGFTVVGKSEFLGSGHPDNPEQPPMLGLIRSRDSGRSWQPVSLAGEADFHVLRFSKGRIYGFDATQGRLMVSDDDGGNWKERRPPAALFDVAVDPRDRDHVVAATEKGLFESRDGGRRWRQLDAQRAGLLAWAPDGLVLVEGQGGVLRSADGGRTWESAGNVGGQPAALSLHGGDLIAGLHTNEVKVSRDGGRSWELLATL